jgi:hypothetical protein
MLKKSFTKPWPEKFIPMSEKSTEMKNNDKHHIN